jgi:uncharacterized protein
MQQLSGDQRALLQKYGFRGDAALNAPQLAAYAAERPGTEAYRAAQLARALGSGRFGRARAPRPPPPRGRWQRDLAFVQRSHDAAGKQIDRALANATRRGNRVTADYVQRSRAQVQFHQGKAEYNRAIAEARRRGNAARVRQLQGLWGARRRNVRATATAQRVAQKAAQRAARQRVGQKLGLWRRGPRSFALNDKKVNKEVVAGALTRLVGVLQDLLDMAGGISLSQAVHALMRKHLGAGTRRVAGAVAQGVVAIAPAAVVDWLVRRYLGVQMDREQLGRVLQSARRVVAGIVNNLKVDVKPLVYQLVMAVSSDDVRRVASSTVTGVLDTYVYQRYVPSSSSSGGALCALCGEAGACGRPASGKAAASPRGSAQRIAALLQRAFRSVNDLLAQDRRGLTLTKALRAAMSSNLDPLKMTLAKAAVTARADALVRVMALPLHPLINKLLKTYGLGISFNDFASIVLRESRVVRGFVLGEPVSIEPFLVKVVSSSQPLGLLQGAVGTALFGAKRPSTSEFCHLCRASCAG